MYLVGEMKDLQAARRLSGQLEDRKIAHEIKEGPPGVYSLWVEKESDLQVAVDLYRLTMGFPPIFTVPEEVQYMRSLPRGKATLTALLASTAVFILMTFGPKELVLQELFISAVHGDLFAEVKSGQFWRLVTPAFLHFGILHFLFNMLWLKDLGNLVENQLGTRFWWSFFIVTAVLSNTAQYLVKGPTFGGLSGVVYGFLGLVWVYRSLLPSSKMGLPKADVIMMIGWFFLCLFDVFGPIANIAHAGGLAMGMWSASAWVQFCSSEKPKTSKVIMYSLFGVVFFAAALGIEFFKMDRPPYFLRPFP